MATWLDGGGAVELAMEPFTALDDYLAWAHTRPDEEHYEVVDGVPVMSPSPGGRHQFAVTQLLILLSAACSDDHVVLPAPFDWLLWEKPRLQIREPDLLVVRRSVARQPRLAETPLLAIEILSPTSFERDVVAKRHEYARVGLRHYWIVDPQTPQIAAYELVDGELTLTAHASGDGVFSVRAPLPVRLKPVDLLP